MRSCLLHTFSWIASLYLTDMRICVIFNILTCASCLSPDGATRQKQLLCCLFLNIQLFLKKILQWVDTICNRRKCNVWLTWNNTYMLVALHNGKYGRNYDEMTKLEKQMSFDNCRLQFLKHIRKKYWRPYITSVDSVVTDIIWFLCGFSNYSRKYWQILSF